MGTKNFRSKEDYRKWLSYGHIHGQFAKTPGNQKIEIRGNPKKVSHGVAGYVKSKLKRK